MQSFKCCQGQSWEIRFSVFMRRLIKKRTGVDILSLLTKETLKHLADETELWIDIVWAAIESQAVERSIDMETFFTKHVDEELLGELVELVYEESIEYAPEKKRPQMRKIYGILKETGRRTIDSLTTHIGNIDEESAVDEIVSEIENSLQLKSTPGNLN